MGFKTYELRLARNGVYQPRTTFGTLKIDESEGVAILDFADSNIANAFADGSDIAASSAIVAAIPDMDPEDSETIWNDSGVLKVASSGA